MKSPMNSIRKRHKPLRQTPVTEETLGCGGDEDNKEDRISNLPDSVLCHILSKLPTKFAVGSGVLSSKWKHLFASIPNLILDIDDSLLLHPHRPADSNRNTKFIAFMHHLLTVTLRDLPCLRGFRLHCNEYYSSAHIDAWVSAALGLNVSSLTLFFNAKNTGVSLDRVFGCTTLVDLLWSQHYLLNVPDYVCLPNLKRLFIDYARFRTGDSLKRVLAGCPVLEELSLDSCEFDDIEVLDISSPSLKLFMMHNCYCEDGYEVVIDTPMLELLYYNDYVAKYYPVRNLNSLLKAHIDIGPGKEQLDEDVEEEDKWFYDLNVAELVIACSNVDYLYLSNASVSAVYCSFQPIPNFHNLTELKLGDLNLHGWELLPRLLESAPNLEILVFTGGISESGGCFTRFRSSLPNYALPCLSLHLTKIYFEEFKGEDDEIELAEYFLEHTVAFERMEFRFCSSLPLEKQFYSWTKLLVLQRHSRNCIEFHRDVKINIVKFCLTDESQPWN